VPAATGDSVFGSVTFTPIRTTPFLTAIFAGSATQPRLVRGGGQTAVRGTTLPQAFTVRVVDGSGFPVANANVTFVVTSGGGNIGGQVNTTVVSNASGLAEVTLTLGSAAGANTVTATVNSTSTGSVLISATGT
jgi:hypothetical protein